MTNPEKVAAIIRNAKERWSREHGTDPILNLLNRAPITASAAIELACSEAHATEAESNAVSTAVENGLCHFVLGEDEIDCNERAFGLVRDMLDARGELRAEHWDFAMCEISDAVELWS